MKKEDFVCPLSGGIGPDPHVCIACYMVRHCCEESDDVKAYATDATLMKEKADP